MTKDTFFSEIANTKPYFKAAFEGFAGSGKTFTATKVAVGLHKKIKSKKPVIIFDTEKAAKFLKPIFAEAKIQVLVKESRSLLDLKETMKRAKEGATDVLIIDSISHVWENWLESYKRAKKRTFLQLLDWGQIKPVWKREFSDPFVQDPYHVIMCGRAGYEYAQEVNEDTGKKEIQKSGIKMKVEGETAYEPDLLVLMERFEDILTDKKEIYRQATIIKDRANLLDGQVFKNPTFKDFEPVITAMMQNPAKLASDLEADAAELVQTDDEVREWKKKKDVTLDKIKVVLDKAFPTASAENKANKQMVCEQAFGIENITWSEIESMSLKELEGGYTALQVAIKLMIEDKKEEMKKVKGK